ncbi:DUF4360 domain-containing protein [Bacteriovorax sp. Seq25_V]|uniref:DUF4360 domain-containing protein n=1 Tax=Bacteriovorax sp. Seq25_V TaxID=1201288 RepID=UPI000389EAAC|nr:DUF4360 domain-containing protein [Bacteriovorax sp. Seq25_V]EQC43933.1 PF14273 domain protein [Bacteriovorax sp. Seq25_V]
MRKMKTALLILGTLSTLSAKALEVQFDSIKLQGRGCSDQNSAVVFSPDRTSASLLFDQMIVEVPFSGSDDFGSGIEKLIDRKVCNISVSLDVPEGERITGIEFQTDFRGMTFGEYGTETEFDSRIISWKDSSGGTRNDSDVIVNRVYSGDFDEELDLSRNAFININSSCNTSSRASKVDFLIRNFIRAEVINRRLGTPTAMLAIDSSDMRGNFKIKLHKEKCSDRGRPTRPTRPTRPGRGDRDDDKIEMCRRLGGIWHDKQRTCISIFGRR